MIVKECVLKNFRNYADTVFKFSERETIFCGANGSGKTNILEALYVLSGIKSFRVSSDEVLVKWGEDSYFISAEIQTEQSVSKLEIGYSISEKKKKVKKDDTEMKSLVSYFGSMICIVLYPGDIQLIEGAPDLRRRYFDRIISTIDHDFLTAINEMRKILKIRSSLLKQNKGKESFYHWDQLLAEKFAIITQKRNTFFSEYTPLFHELYKSICDQALVPEICYVSQLEHKSYEQILSRLTEGLDKDLQYKVNHFGSHRDSFNFKVDDRNFIFVASQGQKRAAALALKIAEKRIIEEKVKEKAIVLIDDIFSELDKIRRHNLISLLGKESQMIIAVTDAADIPETGNRQCIVEINNGCQFENKEEQ